MFGSRKKQPLISEAEAPFVTAIMENPQDDTLRLVYADWLEEQGDSRCEYLRSECEFAQLAQARHASGGTESDDSQRWSELQRELRQQRKRLVDGWLSLMSRSKVACCHSPVRFELECALTWDQLTPTKQLAVRHCDACDSKVYFETSEKAALQRAAKGHCVCLVSDLDEDQTYQERFNAAHRPIMRGRLGVVRR